MQHLLPLLRAELDNPLRPLPAVITPEMTLADLGADALSCTVLSLSIEDALHIRLHDADVTGATTVGDLAALVERKLSEREAA